jgi:putative ABC transport system permease protein
VEFAVRAALGARRVDLVRQVLVEAMVLALAGGAVGVLAAAWGVSLITARVPAGVPRAAEATLDGRVLALALSATLVTGLLAGLVPALRAHGGAHGGGLNPALAAAGRGAGAGRSAGREARLLMTAEVALSLPLLACTAMLARSLVRLMEVDPGFKPRQVLVADVSLLHPNYRNVPARIDFVTQVLDRLHALPGVASAAAAYGVPFGSMLNAQDYVTVPGAPVGSRGERLLADQRFVSPGYFQTLGIHIVRGRAFESTDRRGAPTVAIVNGPLARRLFGDADALGRTVDIGEGAEVARCEIVGVIGDVKAGGLDQATAAEFYLSQLQFCDLYLSLAVRTDAGADAAALGDAVRREVHAVDPGRPVYNLRVLERQVAESLGPRRFTVLLAGALAALAAALAAVGIYGVLAHSVARRTREIGVRVAVGARPRDVVWLVASQAVGPTLAGLAIGTAAALARRRLLAGLVFGISPADPAAFVAAGAMLSLVALAASALPARRASRIDPVEALRHE